MAPGHAAEGRGAAAEGRHAATTSDERPLLPFAAHPFWPTLV